MASAALFSRTVSMAARSSAFRGAQQLHSRRLLSTYFATSHEYVKVEGDSGTVGITDHAAGELGDIVYVDLPEVGDKVEKGEVFGVVESVKAASDVYSPVNGTVTEINEALTDSPSLVNEAALGDGWFVKVKIDGSDFGELLDEAAYAEHIKK